MDFQFQRVLRFVPRPAEADHAHLLLELKKGADPIAITPQQTFSAGKDGKGVELIYRPVRDVVINHGQVEQLKSVFRDASRLRFAPLANSADGLGGALDKDRPKWHAFGHAGLPDAQIGFALASPVLRLAEGTRTIHVERIAKLKSPQAAIKGAARPFATYGGRPLETGKMLTRRAAERLRHRNRCITAWDYERMLLEAFPAVHQVKCIPHTNEGSWLAPGNILLVVVPDLRNQNAVDPLRPRVDTTTLSQMTEFALRHCGMQVRIRVKNPRYQRVKLAFQVKFRPGLPFHFYRRQLHEALVRVLSPWAFEAAKSIQFGGRVYRSVLLDFVEELSYVDFVTDFKLLSPDSDFPHQDLSSIQAATPSAILVSDTLHTIDEFTDA